MRSLSRITLIALLVLTATVTSFVSSHRDRAVASPPQDCFWSSVFDEENGNLFFPDTAVNYYLGRVSLPPGGELLLRGRFPHARYISFNVYDEAGRPTDALADSAIRPDRSSTNPFVVGNRRDRSLRSYTMRVVADSPPAKRKPNTVYLGSADQPRFVGSLVYRVYLPDRGQNQFGGTGLPEVSLRLPDGTLVDQAAACSAPTNQPSTGVTETDRHSGGPGTPSLTTASPRIKWERFFNVTRSLARQFSQDAAEASGDEQRGGFFSDGNNAYVTAMVSREHGDVLVMKGRMPDVPRTRSGEGVFEKAQLRYWSMCNGSVMPTGATDTIGCVYDEQVVTDSRDGFTIVVSTPEDRPANARRACGVTWMPWGLRPEAVMIMRNQLASPDFAHSVQQVRKPGMEREVMGPFLPRGGYTSTAVFEKGGCVAHTVNR